MPSSAGCQGWTAAIQVAAKSYYGKSTDLHLDTAERASVQNKAFEYKQAADNPFLHGVGKGLLKLTPPGLLVGAVGGIGAAVQGIVEKGATQALIDAANAIADFPADLKARLNSADPTIRGEALVDAVALGTTGAAITAGASKVALDSVQKAAVSRALAKAEEEVIAKAGAANNFYREGSAVDYGRAFEFKAGRTLAAEEANARTLSYGNNALDPKPPYLRDSLVSERLAQPGEKFYVIEYDRQSSPGGWASQKQYTSLNQARNELSLLPEFKSGDLVVREYEVVKPMPIREGTVGPLKSNTGETYAGGAKQTEFVFERPQSDSWKEFLQRNETPLKLGN